MNSEQIMSIPEGNSGDDNLRPHLENIKFLKAYYGHCKAYVECHASDKGAFQIERGRWITEMDIKPGAEWQVRRAKLEHQDWLIQQKISPDFLKKCINQLFPRKTKWVSAIETDGFNYFPKEIRESQFDEAIKEGLTLFDTELEAQKACDAANSI